MKNIPKKKNLIVYINIITFILMLLVNYLSNAIPFNGLTQTDISAIFPVLFTPGGYVFSIWGVIYLLLAGFVIYQALPQYRETPYVKAVGILFIITSILNMLWLFAWHFRYVGTAFIIMILFLVTLILIYIRIHRRTKENFFDWLFVKIAFSVYLAWITVATIANLNVLLYDMGWLGTSSFGSMIFTVLMMTIGVLIVIFVFYTNQDFTFPAVIIWALIGIGVRHGTDFIFITMATWVLAAAIIVFVGWMIYKEKFPAQKGPYG